MHTLPCIDGCMSSFILPRARVKRAYDVVFRSGGGASGGIVLLTRSCEATWGEGNAGAMARPSLDAYHRPPPIRLNTTNAQRSHVATCAHSFSRWA